MVEANFSYSLMNLEVLYFFSRFLETIHFSATSHVCDCSGLDSVISRHSEKNADTLSAE